VDSEQAERIANALEQIAANTSHLVGAVDALAGQGDESNNHFAALADILDRRLSDVESAVRNHP
jgi:hypothetical protein